MTKSLDDVGNVRQFISQMKASSPSTLHPERAKTPPPASLTSQDPDHPKPSPDISGLKAPQNTPRTYASSPHLTATDLHNQQVADAFSDYVDAMIGRPLSESIWAPASVRRKPSMLGGAPSAAKALTPVKAVEPNPAINDSFKRMSFRVVDLQGTVGEHLIGDSNTHSIFSKAVKKENEAPSTSKSYLPPHLRATKGSIKDFDSGTRASAQNTSQSSDQNPASSKSTLKSEMSPTSLKGFLPEATGKVKVDPKVTTNSAGTKPQVTTNSAGTKPQVVTNSAGTKPHASSVVEDLEHKLFFNAWPKLEERGGRPVAKVRTVIIKDLPRGSTATFVTSLVYGGPIEEINVRSSAAGDLSAAIRFMDAGDCAKFYEETSNGLVWEKDGKGRERVLFVELSKDVDVVGGLLQTWLASGVTRCVRAVGVAADWGMDGLVKMAERKNRKVEKIVDGQNAFNPLWQARSVVFRFCKVEDAVQFRAAVSRDEEWEHCNIHYAADPCASATGVHFES